MPDPQPGEPTSLEQALTYARRGWRVIPIPPGDKYPRGHTAWQTAGTTDEAKIRHWWTAAPDHGIGIVCGATSSLWVLDVDIADGKHGDDTLSDLVDAYGPLPDTHEVITGSGGRHFYFTWPTDGQVIRNSASGRLGPGLDVRGEGGFVVAPPSLHACGRRYEHEASSPDHISAAPGWLLALLDTPEPARTPQPSPNPPTGDRPGDLWAAATTWAEILEPDGWTLHHTDPDGEAHWTRPGKDRRDGTSATVGYRGSDTLKIFTSSHPQLAAEATYTKLGYLAATRHDGDHSAAARHLAANGWASDPLNGILAPGQHSTTAAARHTAHDTPPEPWPTPVGLPAPDPLPDAPIDAYPAWIADQIRNVTRQLECDPVLPATFALGALSVASLGHLNLAVRAGEILRSTGLYLAVAGPPASGKSPALDMMFAPVREHEHRSMAHAAAEVAKAATRRKIADKAAQQAAESAANTGDPDQARRAEELAAAAQLVNVPPSGELITSDITPERLATLMEANAERMAVVSDESGVLDVDRYNDRGGAKKLDIYLQAFTGQPVAVHRVKAPTVRLKAPLLAIVAGVQPEALAAAMADQEWRTRGMGARFLTATTDRLATNTDIDHDVWDRDVADTYHQRLGDLATRWASWANPALLTLSSDARRRYSTWAAELQTREQPGGDLDTEAGWVSKMRSSVLRIAALFHLADGASHTEPIAVGTLERAIQIGEFFTAHHTHEPRDRHGAALRLLTVIHRLAVEESAKTAQTNARRGLRAARSKLTKLGPRGMRKVDEYTPALIELIGAGLVRLVGAPTGANVQVSAAIRQAPMIEVHPEALELAGCAVPRGAARREPLDDNETAPNEDRAARAARTAEEGFPTPSFYPQTTSPPPTPRGARGARGANGTTCYFMQDADDDQHDLDHDDEGTIFATQETP